MTISQSQKNVCKFRVKTDEAEIEVGGKNEGIRLNDTDCILKPQVALSAYTSYRVGGLAEWFVAPRSNKSLQASVEYAKENGLSITVLGAGSNLLISDRGLPGLVIATRHMRHTNFDSETGTMTFAAGESIPALAWAAAERGCEGFEWAVGIPGTIGGAVVMNAGAHNSCIADMLVSVEVLAPDGTLKTLTNEQLNYSYRTSVLQGSNLIVTQATLQLQPGADPAVVMARTKQHKQHRLATQPYHLPSCGSVFRNPTPHSAGRLIEETGLKGFQIGQAQVAHRHANFIVNCGGATASDIFNLIRHVQHQVQERWSIGLHPEVKMLGFPAA
ncbi:UDP-N-acetylmuramate dehydrogenase [Rivularia sp. UHCC 0363]|uniref:UDP-N-acetylmuramate dehydrogenase n=1 Tax=Rivularia sp. UHCC 0363 TaxID=3110244 RepID=UPI002B1F4B7C|nr:UDP-N-acetylmuramate dehydrogenase [Rivularia sp. UHCC 0363]MEA5596634.1 UDP-N-acetylmuramate dehydrogenase [Rivularia sp. UHCC 0363]